MESIFEPRHIKKFGQTSSENFNEMNKEIGFDLYNLNSSLTEDEAQFQAILDKIKSENYYLSSQIQNIENTVLNTANGLAYFDFYNKDLISYGDEIAGYVIPDSDKAFISHNYNVAMPGMVNSTSKSYLNTEGGESFLPGDVIAYTANVDVPLNPEVEENNPEYALDQDIKTSWVKKFIYNADDVVDGVSVSYELELPKSIFTNMESNMIIIDPYPNTVTDIVNVEYKLNNNSSYTAFDNYMYATDSSNNKIILFSSLDIISLKITFRNTNPVVIDNGNKKMFLVGAQNIAVYNNTFQDESSLYIVFNTSGISKINSVTFDVTNKLNTDGVEYTLYGKNNNTNTLVEFNQGELVSTNYNKTIYIKVTLKSVVDGNEILPPAVENIIVNYDLV